MKGRKPKPTRSRRGHALPVVRLPVVERRSGLAARPSSGRSGIRGGRKYRLARLSRRSDSSVATFARCRGGAKLSARRYPRSGSQAIPFPQTRGAHASRRPTLNAPRRRRLPIRGVRGGAASCVKIARADARGRRAAFLNSSSTQRAAAGVGAAGVTPVYPRPTMACIRPRWMLRERCRGPVGAVPVRSRPRARRDGVAFSHAVKDGTW